MMTTPKSQTPNSGFGHWACVIGICAAGLLLRLAPLGRYVTPDEPAWVYRSVRFADALSARDWAAVPSTGHPGVTTMWLGAAGVAVHRLLDPATSLAHLDWIRRLAWLAPENGEAFRHLPFFLPWGRVAVALVTTLGLVVLYPLLTRLFDRRVALLAVGLLAFDPFLTGHSGLLHTDALLATFSLLALVAALNGLREPRRAVWWALSGLFTGLALLTKTLALILPFFILLTLVIRYLPSAIRHPPLFIVHCSLFIFLTALTFFALYPVTWVAPLQTLSDLFVAPFYHATAALMPTFFAGRTALRHGPEFYAVALPLRLSPIVLVGLILNLRAYAKKKSLRLELACLWLFALGYTLFLALNVKKYDRYLLPALLPLTIVAALGIGKLGNWEIGKLGNWYTGKFVKPVKYQSTNLPICQSTNLLIVLQFLIALAFVFYPLTYFNPLTGGPWVAARLLPVDWGEGMGAAARQLNQLPDADRLTVAALSVPSFASVFTGHTVPLDHASLADYIVRAPTQLPSHPVTQSPSHPITLGFLDHAVVLTNTAPAEQSDYLSARVGPDDLILLDADTPLLRHYTGPVALVSVAAIARPSDYPTTRLPDCPTIWLVADPAASPITAAHLRRALEAIATPVSTTTIASATITQFSILHSPFSILHSPSATFGGQLILIDALLPTGSVNTPFPIFLRWQTPTPTPTDRSAERSRRSLHASLYLRDPAGHLWAEVGQLVLNDVTFPTSAWAPGEWADNELTLKPPQRILPGDYVVQLIVADSAGAQLGAWDAGGQFRGVRVPLGDVEIAPPAEPVGVAECAKGRVLAAGPLLVCIPWQTGKSAPQAVPSGDVLTLALTWSAASPPLTGGGGGGDYAVRWRLLDAAGSVALEQTADLSPYATSRWREGDSFDVRYDLRLDPALPAATCTLALNVLAPDGHPLWAEDEALTTVEILPRDRLFDLPANIAHPLDLTLGNVVHLRGFDLATPPSPPELGGTEGGLRAGDTLPLTLYWQAGGPTDLDYTVFVHLVGPDGQLYGQVDRPPANGAAPTTSWTPGQVIVDEIILPVAADGPAGIYHIAVGMYDGASGGRLPITDASGQSLPDDQAILPVEITIAGGTQ